jgi:hypothetical protein
MRMIDPAEIRGALLGALVVGLLVLALGASPLTAAFYSVGWLGGNALRWLAQRRR